MSGNQFSLLHTLLVESANLAEKLNHRYITLETLLAIALRDDDVKNIITEIEGDYEGLVKEVNDYLSTPGNIEPQRIFPETREKVPAHETSSVTETLQLIVARARAAGKTEVLPKDVFVVIMDSENSYASHFIAKHGIDSLSVKEYISHGSLDDNYEEDDMIMTPMGPMQNPNKKNKPMTEKTARKIVNKYLIDLDKKASQGRIDPLIGREAEVEQVVRILARRKKNNPVLRGEPGVGKTAIPEGLARRIHYAGISEKEGTLKKDDPHFPKTLIGSVIWGLEIGDLVAGTKFRGELEEKITDIIKAITFLNVECGEKNIIFIDEIHTALGAGSTSGGSLDIGNILKPSLASGILRCIGSTTFDEFQKHFEKDRALLRRFRPVDIYEPSDEDTFRILAGLRPYYEEHHGVKYTEDALLTAIRLTKRYVFNAFLPDKAIDAVDSAGATQQILPEGLKKTTITEREIQSEVARMARIQVNDTETDDIAKLEDLAGQLGLKVFGQKSAIVALEDAVYLSKSGLRPHNKTQGSYLFGGPTGVGKTEIAIQISDILGIDLIRFNMSEFMEKHTVSRFIGAPPGYVGFDSQGGAGSGLLTDAVEKQPHAILLFDEVDKAHPDVFNILLQVMDDGKLTNSNGKVVDFRNVILIMTTNAGASDSSKPSIGIGRDMDGFDDSKQMEAIEKFFTPEFRNRLDGIIIFDRLSPEVMLNIVDKFILELNTMSREKKVVFDLDDSARVWLSKEGYSPLFGARPLARKIQEHISKPASRQILFGSLKENGGTVKVSTVKETIKSKTAEQVEKTVTKLSLTYKANPKKKTAKKVKVAETV